MSLLNNRSHAPRRVPPEVVYQKPGGSVAPAPIPVPIVEPSSNPSSRTTYPGVGAMWLTEVDTPTLGDGSAVAPLVWEPAGPAGYGHFTVYDDPAAYVPTVGGPVSGTFWADGAICWDGSKIILLARQPFDTYLVDRYTTWEWTGAVWNDITTGNEPLVHFSGIKLAWDQANGKVVGVSTANANTAETVETWLWDGSDWTNAAPATPILSPVAITGVALNKRAAFGLDWDGSRVVLHGGFIDNSFGSYPGWTLDDTWAWDGTDWTLLAPAHKPTHRGNHMMSWDGGSGLVMGFGFGIRPGPVVTGRDDTWTWNGSDWTQVVGATVPTVTGGSVDGGAWDGGHVMTTVNRAWEPYPDDIHYWARWTGTDWEEWVPGEVAW